jgi:O-antigen/teichoic acid export membrane protein
LLTPASARFDVLLARASKTRRAASCVSAMPDRAPSNPGRSDIRRGLVWLGAASVVARILDAATVLVVMWFVSREQIGLATLAWSVAVFLEAMNGLGLGAALLQARDTSAARLTAAFWCTLGFATLLVGLVSVTSGAFARWFDEPRLAPMLIVATTKLWFVGGALVPLNQLNRATQFERIAAVSTLATLGAGLLTCGLAVSGFQAWSLVIGQVSHGLFTCIGAQVAHPFRPRGRAHFGLIRDDVKFGIKAASSTVLNNFYRNADYYLIGRILGTSALGAYRVAFDLAMTPTIAVLTVVNRSALPVYARMSDDLGALRNAFLWTLRSLGILLAPVTAILFFMPEDLLRLASKGEWLDAAPMVRWLSLAAFVRSIAQTFPQLFHALKRPVLALYDALFSMLILVSFLSATLLLWGGTHGPLVATWAWAAMAPIDLVALSLVARALISVSLAEIARALAHAVGSLAAMAGAYGAYLALLRPQLPAWLSAPSGVALLLLSFALYTRLVMGVGLRSLSARSSD